jgi:hypothetical protein
MKILILFLFIATTTGFQITCNYKFTVAPSVGTFYTCDVIATSLNDNFYTDVRSVLGTHLNGYTSNDVQYVAFNGINALKYITPQTTPQGLQNFFPNLQGLSFENYPLTKLRGNELEKYNKLKFFLVSNTNLDFIDGNLFASTPNMGAVFLNNNKIAKVGKGLLSNLKNLLVVDFYSNVCINKNASFTSTGSISSLISELEIKCGCVSSLLTCGKFLRKFFATKLI